MVKILKMNEPKHNTKLVNCSKLLDYNFCQFLQNIKYFGYEFYTHNFLTKHLLQNPLGLKILFIKD